MPANSRWDLIRALKGELPPRLSVHIVAQCESNVTDLNTSNLVHNVLHAPVSSFVS